MWVRLLIVAAMILGLTALTWSGLWRQYRWIYGGDLPAGERTILERQIVAMGVYFPIHLSAIILPVEDMLRGYGSIVAAFVLGYIGYSAVQHRLFAAFNRQTLYEVAAFREKRAIAAGGFLLLLAVVVLGLGLYLLYR